jgi:hypothetical protein
MAVGHIIRNHLIEVSQEYYILTGVSICVKLLVKWLYHRPTEIQQF